MARYWEGPEGRRFCFTNMPDFRCPMTMVRYDVTELGTGKVTVTDARPATDAVGITHTRHVSEDAARAAELLGVEPKKLLAMVQNSHRHAGGPDGIRARVDGRLTDRCKVCGAKLLAFGYYAYVEEPVPADELSSEQAVSGKISARMFGGDGTVYRRVKGVQVDTKREAKQWAYDELRAAQAIAEEEG